jgi:hypothetical protein
MKKKKKKKKKKRRRRRGLRRDVRGPLRLRKEFVRCEWSDAI